MQNRVANDKKGVLVVVSGFAGSGKGTVVKEIISKYDNYALSISATTRAPRPGEVDGREYFFKTKEEFEEMIEKGMLIEYAQYVGNYYGTPREYVEKQLEEGKDVILEIEIQGAMKIKERFKDAILVFMTPPSATELYNRLKGRNTESQDVIMARMARAIEESKGMGDYDYLLINDTVDACVCDLQDIVLGRAKQLKDKDTIIKNIQAGLAEIVEGE